MMKSKIIIKGVRKRDGRIGPFRSGKKDDLKLGINAIKVLERRYLLRDTEGNVIETPSQLFHRVARTMASVEKKYGANSKEVKEWEERFYSLMAEREFLPNTPCLVNAGARLHQLSACFVVDVQDSLDSMFQALSITAKIHQSGGGTGFSFSEIRPKGDLVRSTGGRASGPLSFMKIFDQMTDTIKQGGVRRGANMGILSMQHPDIVEFVTMKADPRVMKNFNVSVAVTDQFMRAVERGGAIPLVNPRTGKKVKDVPARGLFNLITTYAWRTGDPGMVFMDEVNRRNPTKHLGRIEATNPCGEVPLHPWEACNLGSINLAKFVEGEPMKGSMQWQKLQLAVRDCVRFLDNMIDASRFPDPRIAKAVHGNRRIGLGIMGFAEALILLGIPYDSERALKFAEEVMRFIEQESLAASSHLGRERGSFPNFKGSQWQKNGYKSMRNATTIVIAPTGTISVIAGCSSGIEPLFAVSFVRNVMEGTRLVESNALFEAIARKNGFHSEELLMKIARTGSVQGLPEVPKKVQRLFATALEIRTDWHVRMQAAFQKYTHSAVSKTINFPEYATVENVRRAYMLAWKLKCKGITIYRYGSKPEQVLTIGPRPLAEGGYVTAESEFAGGCPGGVCGETTT